MGDVGFQLLGVRDSRIAAHAVSVHPAWLWSTDGLRLLWCNAAAASAFGIRSPILAKTFSIADPRARQVVQLSDRLTSGSLRLERLRDFGKPLGGLLTCACSRLDLVAGNEAVLIVAMELVGRAPTYEARLQWLVDSLDRPASAFDSDGHLVASNAEARDMAANVRTLSDLENGPHAGSGPVVAEPGRIKSDLYTVGTNKERATIVLMSLQASKPDKPEPPQVVLPAALQPNERSGFTPVTESLISPDIHEAAATADNSASSHRDPDRQSAPPQPDDGQWITDRRHPLRFLWQMNAEGRFSLGGDEFSRMLGPQTAAALGRPWDEVERTFGLDPDGHVARAIATRDTWSGIIVNWPFDGFGHRLPVELSALPLHDRARNFLGYRGFGVCHDIDGLNRIALVRQQDGLFGEQTAETSRPSQDNDSAADEPAETPAATIEPEATAMENPPVDNPPNVVPFRPLSETTVPVLTPVENNAFDEIARRLSEGLGASKAPKNTNAEVAFELSADISMSDDDRDETNAPVIEAPLQTEDAPQEPTEAVAPWLAETAPPPIGQSLADRPLLDLMPAGILIYRLEQLLYSNTAFLQRLGFDGLPALQSAGGLEALEIEPQSSTASSTSRGGMPLTVTVANAGIAPAQGHLFSIQWDGEQAHALVLSSEAAAPAAPPPAADPAPEPRSSSPAEFSAILEAATDAIVLFDRSGEVTACNRRAQTLFGYPSAELNERNLTDLFAFESQRIVLDYFESIDQPGVTTIYDHGREVVGCKKGGQFVPLSMTMGRSDDAHFFAVFRDLSQLKQNEAELLTARRRAERATSAKTDALAKISHDIRAPLNTIIGFANMMIEEKLGALGNTRYLEYTKDIRASAEQVLSVVGDMLDLSEVETGRVKLDFQQQSLNETVEKCVSLAQPQANRERIIIRTSLAHHLPPVLADMQALRQIATNLITSSIRLSKAGGQVIVSTALDEKRAVVLRVRDMGRGMSDTEVASTMEPYRPQAITDLVMPESGVDLSLTKALAEANRARFQIRTTLQAGTLIEVAFPAA